MDSRGNVASASTFGALGAITSSARRSSSASSSESVVFIVRSPVHGLLRNDGDRATVRNAAGGPGLVSVRIEGEEQAIEQDPATGHGLARDEATAPPVIRTDADA